MLQAVYIHKKTRGSEECIGETNEKRGIKEDCQLGMRNLKRSNELSLDDIYNIHNTYVWSYEIASGGHFWKAIFYCFRSYRRIYIY
jgi:hypothetical protein